MADVEDIKVQRDRIVTELLRMGLKPRPPTPTTSSLAASRSRTRFGRACSMPVC